MGQEICKSTQIYEQPRSTFQIKKNKKQYQSQSTLHHQGLLRVAKIPFQNCQEKQINNQIYFIEHTKMNLKTLIQNKVNLKETFSEQEIIKLIQNMVYVLAYLQHKHQQYPFLTSQQIFECNGTFKLLPPSIIKKQLYTKLKLCLKQQSKQYIPVSPQLFQAFQSQPLILPNALILLKTNVFALGLLLIEVCTLKPSIECYDLSNYNILNEVLKTRIKEVSTIYPKKIGIIVEKMLELSDKDRMTFKQLSIFVNRTFHSSDISLNNTVANKDEKQAQQINKSNHTEQPSPIQQKSPQNNSILQKKSTRIQQIRARKTKQKKISNHIKKQNQKQLHNSNKNKQKFLPNPYFNSGDILKSGQKSNSYRNISPKFMDISLQSPKTTRYQNYKTPTYQPPSNQPLNQKYKYSLDQDPIPNIHNSQKKYQKLYQHQSIFNDQKTLSNRKDHRYDYEYPWDRQHIFKINQLHKEIQHYNQRQGSQNKKLKSNQKSIINIQPIIFTQHMSQFNLQQKQPKLPLSQKKNISTQSTANYDKFCYQKNLQPILLARHQLFQYDDKISKNYGKEKEDMVRIKKEIQKSKKIIQQVKKCEQQNIYN